MKCERCVEAGQKSRVNIYDSSRTLMGGSGPYYDEDGVYHSHDPNTVTCGYSCTNGHRWVTKGRGECPADGCDYGGVTETIFREEGIKAYPAKDFYDDSGKLRVGPTEVIPMAVDSTEVNDG